MCLSFVAVFWVGWLVVVMIWRSCCVLHLAGWPQAGVAVCGTGLAADTGLVAQMNREVSGEQAASVTDTRWRWLLIMCRIAQWC